MAYPQDRSNFSKGARLRNRMHIVKSYPVARNLIGRQAHQLMGIKCRLLKESYSRFAGSGIRVSLVKEMIHRLYGKILLRDFAGKSTDLHIQLPLSK